ncbi:MAG: methyl-accepting chemotaxis protein [Deltaproteobacteria bacterium]|nr:MAG: methyl-accepting chemotaxis protein [Deltaproteobacteria bacterium]
MKTKTRRQQYSIVDRSLQYRVLAIIVTYSLVIVLFLVICLFVPDILAMSNEELSWEIRGLAAEKLLTLHSRVWPAIIAMVCVLGIHSVRIFHRLIGPLYRFRWAFAEIAKGALNFRVQIRKSDYLHKENEALNEMINALADQCESIQQAGSRALDSLTALEQGSNNEHGGRNPDQELLKQHRKLLEDLLDRVKYFRVSPEESGEQEEKHPD